MSHVYGCITYLYLLRELRAQRAGQSTSRTKIVMTHVRHVPPRKKQKWCAVGLCPAVKYFIFYKVLSSFGVGVSYSLSGDGAFNFQTTFNKPRQKHTTQIRTPPRAQVSQITPKPSTSSRSLLSFTAGLPRRRAACTAGRGARAPAFRFHAPRLARWLCTWAAPGAHRDSGVGNFGGGRLEHPRQWLGAQWPSLPPWECRAAQSCPEPPGAS